MRIVEELKNHRYIYLFCAFFVAIHFGLFCRVHYSPDCYTAIATQMSPLVYLRTSGRLVMGAYFYILGSICSSYHSFYAISFVLAVLFSFLAVIKYSKLIIPELHHHHDRQLWNDQMIAALLSCITITNLFCVEYLLCTEQALFMISIWAVVEAVDHYLRYHKSHENILLWMTSGYLLVVAFTYQTILLAFVALFTPFAFIYSDNWKRFLKWQILGGGLCVMAMLPQYVYTKMIINSERLEAKTLDFAEAAVTYAPTGASPKQYILQRITMGMWIYIFICIFLGVVLIKQAVKKKEYLEIIKGICIVLIVVLMGVLPFILRLTDDFRPRIYYPLGMLPGILIFYGIRRNYLDGSTSILIVFAISVLVLSQWNSFVEISQERYMTNYEDEVLSKVYGESIRQYEETTGQKISNVVFYEDAEKTKYIRNGWCLSSRVYGVNWGRRQALNYYLNSSYADGVIDLEIAQDYHNRNWDTFSEEQITFVKETAHICTY